MRVPPVRILLVVFIVQDGLKRATMQRANSPPSRLALPRSLPRSGKSLGASSGYSMSEQERKPAPAGAGASELPASQEVGRIHRAAPTGGIDAETITQTTNIVSGEQHIGTQINYGSSVPSHTRAPPLQRP